jgi:hypothetical protein
MKNKEVIILICTLSILVLVAGGILIYKYITRDKDNNALETNTEIEENTELVVDKEKPQVQIFKGTDRPIAVMIDNHSGAWPQANLNQAYMVYEIVVEGGETRLMAVFKGRNVDKIGPVRSSRHYFLDYALENDAIYVHYGWSPQAESDIKTLGINNINGITESSSSFWRVKDKSSPHNVLTSTENILKIAERNQYKTSSQKESVLKYSAEEVQLTSEDSIVANKIVIPHSKLQTVTYEYNAEQKTYTRYARGNIQKDYATGADVTTKNIIITKCDNYDLSDSENKGRQGLKNIGTFDGYYITNGKAIKIKCTKSARNAQTVYKDLQGNEINVNDGNTFVNICPTDAKIVIE